MIDILIPSYHRADNIKTAKYFKRLGYDMNNIHVIIDNEADDYADYLESTKSLGCNLYVIDINEARKKYDFVHRPSKSRRAAGMSRNMFYEYAESKGIDFYIVIDDDCTGYQIRPFQRYVRKAELEDFITISDGIKNLMEDYHIGCFGVSQTGDMFERYSTKMLRFKVMNTTFYNIKYIYWGERGVQDNDTSQFVSILNEGYFTGSLQSGIVLQQVASATQKGGLTDLYNECKLLNKALVTPIQFPSCITAEKQQRNGGRLHHKINYRYLMPKILKTNWRDNIEWDTYIEDKKFTNLVR